ncbi:MAG: CRTAC1 family protein [Candidatus Eisenbacteria bacterium]
MRYAGQTWGAAAGDVDGDGWPDLLVGNHCNKPTVYINRRDGTFEDVAEKVWRADLGADMHGAAFADFDNDGDQDVIVTIGAMRGQGSGPNQLLVNRDGVLVDEAVSWGVDYPLARGRTPTWVDADGDGKLDLLLRNQERDDRRAPSAIFLQASGRFLESNASLGFSAHRDYALDKSRRYAALVQNVLRLRFQIPRSLFGWEFAQLADLSGDGRMDLVSWGTPTRVFGLTRTPFTELTYRVGFPKVRGMMSDAVFGDFDGDLATDVFCVGEGRRELLWLAGPHELRARIATGSEESKMFLFETEGAVSFQLGPRWYVPESMVFIGTAGRKPPSLSFTLSSSDSLLQDGDRAREALPRPGVFISLAPDGRTWGVEASLKGHLALLVKTSAPIEGFEALNFPPVYGGWAGKLLLRRENGFVVKDSIGTGDEPLAFRSVAAGDFDNDMDLDLYMVGTGFVRNTENALLENDGAGRFAPVPGAGGASGSTGGVGECVVVLDYDRDGFLDLFVANGEGSPPFCEDGPHQLFRNSGNDNHWIEIDLEGVLSNRDGIGAQVVAETGGISQAREQGGGMHRASQNHQRVHFGLGTHDRIDRLTVRWPSGVVQELTDVEADQILTIRESPGPRPTP